MAEVLRPSGELGLTRGEATLEEPETRCPNRLQPVYDWGSKVTLQKDGAMVLKNFNGDIVWKANGSSSSAIDHAQLLNTGNLVLKDRLGNILWQSFDSPTDTLLPTQPITANTMLVSSNIMLLPGQYSFRFSDEYLLSLFYRNSDSSKIYWPDPHFSIWDKERKLFNTTRIGVLNELGQFLGSDGLNFTASDMGPGIKRRLTLDYDGNVRLYSLNESNGPDMSSTQNISLDECIGICTTDCSCKAIRYVAGSEGLHKMLVYEFVDNGSLARILFGDQSSTTLLHWKHRVNIAIGIARGLAYLHHECLEWIIHCDVKPENILLDKSWEPKIVDFGLAKLLSRCGVNKNVSQVRGTRGYMAPEWVSNLPITTKADVYSFGVVLLELVKGIRISNWFVDGEEGVETTAGDVVKVLSKKMGGCQETWVNDFVDSRLHGDLNYAQAISILNVAILCLEEDPRKRPNMKSLLQMLLSIGKEGDDDDDID
ncbi:hypothetical protein GUJ93_ZPchr0011g28692 [Zizania palustris]|uniref:Uncharacterized protein n=1 Tax=Zizania palustris TaxID=103762 RepID=A0A8J6BKY0_ZIZPA|nr:hypothetical protein GUJ93_ZPchr0011g28692 [Zizania palustris]